MINKIIAFVPEALTETEKAWYIKKSMYIKKGNERIPITINGMIPEMSFGFSVMLFSNSIEVS